MIIAIFYNFIYIVFFAEIQFSKTKEVPFVILTIYKYNEFKIVIKYCKLAEHLGSVSDELSKDEIIIYLYKKRPRSYSKTFKVIGKF